VTLTINRNNGDYTYPITADWDFAEFTVADLAASPAAASVVAPGRDDFHNPAIPGLRIYRKHRSNTTGCTASFAYREPRFGQEVGLVTAGHCFRGESPTTIWAQGNNDEDLGAYSRNRDVARTRADAGTITTSAPVGSRNVADTVFIYPTAGTIRIVRVQARNSGMRGDLVCISGAYSAFHCGQLITAGAGKDWHGRDSFGHRQVISHVYRAKFGPVALRAGDSGAPVFTGDGVALGVFFARKSKQHTQGFYSQIRNVEDELNVSVMR
jgi:hypothetical protein